MTESDGTGWVEDLHPQAESMCFWEEEPEQIDLGTCCIILSYSLWKADIPIAGYHYFWERKYTRDISIQYNRDFW